MQFFKINAFLDFRGHTAALFDNSIADSLVSIYARLIKDTHSRREL